MTNILWDEMYYAKKNIEFLSIYISFIRTTRKYIDLFTLLFTTTGIISWFSENNENLIFTGISLFLAAFLQVVDIIQTKFVASDEYIDNVRQLKAKWITYFDTLEKIWFDIRIKKIESSSYDVLNDIYGFLMTNSDVTIEIGGHTNGIPDDDYCDRLSTARAKAVAEYLVEKGVTPSKVQFKGYGKRKPIADNKTKFGRDKNQRVEIKILSLNT